MTAHLRVPSSAAILLLGASPLALSACEETSGPRIAPLGTWQVEHFLFVSERGVPRGDVRRCPGVASVSRQEGSTVVGALRIEQQGDCGLSLTGSFEGILDERGQVTLDVEIDRSAFREILQGCDVPGELQPFRGRMDPFFISVSMESVLQCPSGVRQLFWEIEGRR